MENYSIRDMRDYLGSRPPLLVGQHIVRTSELVGDYAKWAKANRRYKSNAVSVGVALRYFYPDAQGIQLRVERVRKRFIRNQTPFLPADDLDDLL